MASERGSKVQTTGSESGAIGPVRTLAEIVEDPSVLEPPEAVVEGLAYKGRVTLLTAGVKQGKTTLAAAMASAVSNGSDFVGRVCERGKVVWFGVEEALGDVVTRLVHFGADHSATYVTEHVDDPVAAFQRLLKEVGPSLIIIDTLPKFVSLLENEHGSMHDTVGWTRVMAKLVEPIHNSDTALVLVHHSRRTDGEYLGPTAVGGQVDMIVTMEEAPKDVRKLKPVGRWRADDFQVRFDKEREVFELVGREPTIDSRVLDYVAGSPGASKRSVRSAVSASNAKIDAAIDRLLTLGRLIDRNANGGGNGMALEVPEDGKEQEAA